MLVTHVTYNQPNSSRCYASVEGLVKLASVAFHWISKEIGTQKFAAVCIWCKCFFT